MLLKRRRQRREAAAKRRAGDVEAQQLAVLSPPPPGVVDSSGIGGGPAQLPATSPQDGVIATSATESQRLWERFRQVGWGRYRTQCRVMAICSI